MKRPPALSTPDASDSEQDSGAPASERTGRALELLAQVRTGAVPGSMLAPPERRGLVTLLTADGASVPEIAQILQVSDRTIERDRREIRTSSAIAKDPQLVGEMVGRLMAEAELTVQRIRRTARERDVDPGVKVDAEHKCYSIIQDLVRTLQGLGYLPTAAHRLEADLAHHTASLPPAEEVVIEYQRLRELAPDDATLESLDHAFGLAELVSQLKDYKEGLAATQDDESDDDDGRSEEVGEDDTAEEGGPETDDTTSDGGAQEGGRHEDQA